MSAAPYETTFRHDGELCFLAPVPALAQIGLRFDGLFEASKNYLAPPDECKPWRELSARLRDVADRAKRGESVEWPEILRQLEQEYGQRMTKTMQGVMRPVSEFFETKQMPLSEYLEWVLQAANQCWARIADKDFDWDTHHAQLDRLTAELGTRHYETASDRQRREADPAGYADRVRMLQQTMQVLNEPDPAKYQELMEQQLASLKDSPFFTRMRDQLGEVKERLEAMPASSPEEKENQLRGFEQVEKFWTDPMAHYKNLLANIPGGEASNVDSNQEVIDDPTEIDADEEPPEPALQIPPGQFLFRCGDREKLTDTQIAQYEQFMAAQEKLRPKIEKAIRQMHHQMNPMGQFTLAGDRVLFPENSDSSDVPLHCFRVERITLSGKEGAVVIDLDSHFGHYDEHGCLILIRDGKLQGSGTFDDVFQD
jgi:hypothetical protein